MRATSRTSLLGDAYRAETDPARTFELLQGTTRVAALPALETA